MKNKSLVFALAILALVAVSVALLAPRIASRAAATRMDSSEEPRLPPPQEGAPRVDGYDELDPISGGGVHRVALVGLAG